MNNSEKRILENNKHLIVDVISGDESTAIREDFKNLSKLQLHSTLNLLLTDPNLTSESKTYLLTNAWKLLYRQQPPKNIDDFLSEAWIGPSAKNVYPHVRKDLIDFFNPNNKYRNIYLASAIGAGKSFSSTMIMLYILINVSLMRDPKKYFNLAETSSIVGVLGSFTMTKAKQLLLAPFYNVLKSSPKFRNVRMSERIIPAQEEEYKKGSNRIVWTTASRIDGDIEFDKDVHVVRVSDVSNLLGMSIIAGALSELSFFLDKGISPEMIDRFRTDLDQRIYSRFNGNYWGRMIIDSSPNDMDLSPIDKFVFTGEAQKEEKNMVINQPHWKLYPDKYPIWQKTGEVFFVFKGSGSKQPKIISEDEVKDYLESDIYKVPIDIKDFFSSNSIVKAVKDYCAWPAGSEDKLISNPKDIENIFYKHLINEYDAIEAPNNKLPEGLIWDQIYKKYFIETSPGRYEFYRSPLAPRFLSVDQSRNKDITSIGCFHPELDEKGRVVVVTDFIIPIKSGKNKIGVEATGAFIIDLVKKGNMSFTAISMDQYQSDTNKDKVERELGIKVTKSLADLDPNVYHTLYSWIQNKRFKSGYSIFLKNNLKSVKEIETKGGKKKIDHTQGKIVKDPQPSVNWETDQRGVNAKDLSDCAAQAVFMVSSMYKGTPRYQWREVVELLTPEQSKEELLLSLKQYGLKEWKK